MGCERHEGKCAYTGAEPDRCPRCHATWDVIASPHSAAYPNQGGGPREAHERWHDVRDAAAARRLAARRAARAAVPEAA
jgi:hypothetical protein